MLRDLDGRMFCTEFWLGLYKHFQSVFGKMFYYKFDDWLCFNCFFFPSSLGTQFIIWTPFSALYINPYFKFQIRLLSSAFWTILSNLYSWKPLISVVWCHFFSLILPCGFYICYDISVISWILHSYINNCCTALLLLHVFLSQHSFPLIVDFFCYVEIIFLAYLCWYQEYVS